MFPDELILLFLLQILRPPTIISITFPTFQNKSVREYFDLDFTGFLYCFLFDECNHSLEFVGDLFIAETLGIGHRWWMFVLVHLLILSLREWNVLLCMEADFDLDCAIFNVGHVENN